MIETVPQTHSAHDFETLGFNADWEVKRRKNLIEKFGQLGAEVARFEHERSASAYEREFVDDVPYSAPQIYYDDLLTMPSHDPLFEMAVDMDERGGFTKLGFEELRARVRDARTALNQNGKDNEVVVWYSPPGKAGEGKFGHLNFDSGRIYLTIVDRDSPFPISFDVKVLEELFPSVDFLNELSGQSKVDSWQYLTEPFRTNMTAEEFHERVMPKWGNQPVYTRQRFTNPQPYTVGEVLNGVREELQGEEFQRQMRQLLGFEERFRNFVYKPATYGYGDDYERETYMEIIGRAFQMARQNGAEGIVLYGCSATGIRTPEQLKKFDFSAKAIFETAFRVTTAEDLLKKTDYKDDPNLCRCSQGSGPHFHCPGKDDKGCGHAIVVGQGVEECPSCGKDKTC